MFLKGTMMSIESIVRFLGSMAIVAGLAIISPQVSRAQINDSVARHNGASFWANQRTSRNIQHARDYSRGIQQYSTRAPMVYSNVLQPETQMLGQQLQCIQRDLGIVRQENASKPIVVEQVKKLEAQVAKVQTVQKSLDEECCKASPNGKHCGDMSSKLLTSLEEMKKEHDKLLKELGHEEAAHSHHAEGHDHPIRDAGKSK
jgi:hypothetical protein